MNTKTIQNTFDAILHLIESDSGKSDKQKLDEIFNLICEAQPEDYATIFARDLSEDTDYQNAMAELHGVYLTLQNLADTRERLSKVSLSPWAWGSNPNRHDY